MRLDMERILALKPDLAVGWRTGNTRADLEKLAALGIPVFSPSRNVWTPCRRHCCGLGHLAGVSVKQQPPPLPTAMSWCVCVPAIGSAGRSGIHRDFHAALMTLNHAHLTSDLLALCGGHNVFAAYDLIAPEVSVEAVMLQDPDAILFSDELGTAEGVA